MPAIDRTSRKKLFWTLHGGGWLAYAASLYVGNWFYDKPAGYGLVIATAAVSGFALTLPLRFVYRRLWRRPPAAILLVTLAVCYPIALIWRVIINNAYRLIVEPTWRFETPFEMFGGAISSMYVLLCWTALYFGIRYYESLQLQREATLQSAALAQEAQLKMLRYQLNPHFLFNTLNAISTLILDNRNHLANQSVTRLAQFLRYTLDQDPMNKVTLRQEIDALDLYLSTERLRFGDRLRLEFALEDAALEVPVPSLLLQPLIENAVKHAIAPREEGGAIRIEGRVRGSMLELAVVDDGPGLKDGAACAEGRGVGLRNTRERLAVLYGEHHRFVALNAHPGLRIEIGLPREAAEAPAHHARAL